MIGTKLFPRSQARLVARRLLSGCHRVGCGMRGVGAPVNRNAKPAVQFH